MKKSFYKNTKYGAKISYEENTTFDQYSPIANISLIRLVNCKFEIPNLKKYILS